METRKHTIFYKTLEEVTDFKLSTLVVWWNKLPKTMRIRNPLVKEMAIFRNLAICSALYITGGRASEVAHIRLRDISFEDSWIYIKLINRKNKRNPTKEIMANLEIEQVFLNWLVKYYNYRINQVEDMDAPLFPIMQNNIEYNVFLNQRTIYSTTTRFTGINPHFFRKLRASHLLEYYGFDVKALQQYLGWSSVLSSEPYLRISKSGIKKSYLQHQDDVKKIIEGVGK
jgi:site-specific recombinase XerD